MSETYNILALGDVVGSRAAEYIKERLNGIKEKYAVDFTVINGENSADGNGMLRQSIEILLDAGADVVTGGNHSFRRREVYNYLDECKSCIRPANMPPDTPGFGSVTTEVGGKRILVINLLGTVYMESLDSPFSCAAKILESNKGKYDFAVVDIHAEATSEKAALARYLDGMVSVVFGTHTHVTTADEQILPRGTGFITDLGMSGVHDSILGVKSEIIIEKYIKKMPVRFEAANGKIKACGAVFSIDRASGKCVSVQRISF